MAATGRKILAQKDGIGLIRLNPKGVQKSGHRRIDGR